MATQGVARKVWLAGVWPTGDHSAASSVASVRFPVIAASQPSSPGHERLGRGAGGPGNRALQNVGREALARADRWRRGKVGMRVDPAAGNLVASAQVSEQNLRRGQLPGRGRLFIQVADEADADAVLVDIRVLGVATMDSVLLVDPALGDLDLAVA